MLFVIVGTTPNGSPFYYNVSNGSGYAFWASTIDDAMLFFYLCDAKKQLTNAIGSKGLLGIELVTVEIHEVMTKKVED